MGYLVELLGPRGQIDTCIGRNDTVRTSLTKRRRNHRTDLFLSIEKNHWSLVRTDAEDEILWNCKQDVLIWKKNYAGYLEPHSLYDRQRFFA